MEIKRTAWVKITAVVLLAMILVCGTFIRINISRQVTVVPAPDFSLEDAIHNNLSLDAVARIVAQKPRLVNQGINGTPLYQAAFADRPDLCKLLLDSGADINAPFQPDETGGGDTPLMVAIEFGHPKVVKLLLSCGADLARKNARGQTASDLAKEYPDPGITKMISDAVDKAN